VGADIGFHVGKNFLDEKPQQFYPAAIFKLMVDHNMLGEKTPSGGFYSFEKNKCAVCSHASGSDGMLNVSTVLTQASSRLSGICQRACAMVERRYCQSTRLHADSAVCGVARLRTGVDIVTHCCRRRAGTPNPKIKPLIEEARKAAKVPPADQLGLSPKVPHHKCCIWRGTPVTVS
jgi:hypothetical protein